MTRLLRAADLFCGAGGTTAGAEATGACRVEFAVNHWDVAVATHSANFPHTKHVNMRLDRVSPGECGKIDLLFASPECTGFSRARGGRPTSDQQRSGAMDVMKWIEHHRPAELVIENAAEFQQWGPLHNDRPMKSGRGKLFEAWISMIRACGYQVDWRILNAADFGAATSRRRLFVRGRKGRKQPRWPEPTHTEKPHGAFPGMSLPSWRAAAEVIDWSIPCPSIFGRNIPLAENTLLRLEAGLRTFVGPFIAQWDNQGGHGSYVRSPDRPMHTFTTKANAGLAVPFMLDVNHGATPGDGGRVRSLGSPLRSATTKRGEALAMPFIVPNFGEREGQPPRTHDISNPMPAATGHGAGNLAVPLVMSALGGGVARSASQPTPTLTARGGCNLIIPLLASYYRTGTCNHVGCPLSTITTEDRFCLLNCHLCGIDATVARRYVDEPTPAMRKLLATMRELGVADIGFRMLKNPELAAAQGFNPSYVFHGKKYEVTRQIGNSVSPPNARALTEAILSA